jgi:hypothetical protein
MSTISVGPNDNEKFRTRGAALDTLETAPRFWHPQCITDTGSVKAAAPTWRIR